ncbi:type I DNA topoisomerase [Patescibacteria group bacterium]
MQNLIIVESPTKAKTISKFLGKDYKILSSFGHVRDLPTKEMGIDIENNFKPTYVIPAKAKSKVNDLKKIAKDSKNIILATDEDREGEAISWHLLEIFGKQAINKYQRIAFHEITKSAIEEALKNPRKIDMNLVDSQQARRILDRLVGYEMSPFLWRKVAKGLSAGRVQSVTVRLIVEREKEIQAFKSEEYWTIEGLFQKTSKSVDIKAKLDKINGKKIEKLAIQNEKSANKILEDLKKQDYSITSIKKKQTKKNPYPPFTTSTLQQESNKKLGFSSKQTMVVAQQLYETGLITYMRTDSLNLSKEAVSKMRNIIKTKIGGKYIPANPIIYKTKSKGAQEAHEAIRPAYPEKHPDELNQKLNKNQFKLYDLIWRRAMACQMNPAIIDNTTIDISNKSASYTFRANGSIIKFDGFLKIYHTQTEENILPELENDEKLKVIKIDPSQHFTQPPARYSEASLIKILEEYGIGRPSTYAPTIDTIQKRNYVKKEDDKKLHPTEIGIMVNDILVKHFKDIVDYKFTAKIEEDFDDIEEGTKKWQPIIKEFYMPFKKNLIKKDKELTKKALTEEKTDQVCEKCKSKMVIKMGRFGKFLACSNYPECKNTKHLAGAEGSETQKELAKELDEKCPQCNSPLVLRHGKFGEFTGCSNYPKCKFIKNDDKTTGVHCPKCEKGEIIEKKSRKGIFYACNQYPKCRFALWYKPTGYKCPKCDALMVTKITKKDGERIVCSNKECGK